MTKGTLSRPGSAVYRVLLTLGPVLLLLLGRRILAPGIDREVIAELEHPAVKLDVFALGLTPVVSAYVLVEFVALLVPRWRRLRHTWPEGRVKLERAAALLALLLAALQALAVAEAVRWVPLSQQASPFEGEQAHLVFALSLMAGVCVLWVMARVISRQRIANGMVTLIVTIEVERALALVQAWFEARTAEQVARDGPPILGALVMLGGAVWLALRGSQIASERVSVLRADARSSAPDGKRIDFDSLPWVPVPASSFQPLAIAAGALMLPRIIDNFRVAEAAALSEWLREPGLTLNAMPLLTLLAGALLALLFHRPASVAFIAKRVLADESTGSALRFAKRVSAALRGALLPTSLALVCLAFANATCHAQGLPLAWLIVPLVALAMDLESPFAARTAGLVCVWHERRVYAVPLIREALARAGVTATVLELNQAIVYQIFAPFVAAQIWVPASDAARARALLVRRLLSLPASEDGESQESLAANTDPPAAPAPAPVWYRWRVALLGAAAVGAVASSLLVRPPPRSESSLARGRSAPAPVSLEILYVDDGVDPFSSVGVSPAGFSLMAEVVGLGPDEKGTGRFARFVPLEGESLDQAARRTEPFLAGISLPPGAKFALGRYDDEEPSSGRRTQVGWRSYVVYGPPIVTAQDIEHAEAVVDRERESVSLDLRLFAGGAERFHDATRDYTGRRLAIVVDGRVASCPLVLSAIPGGRIQIDPGAGTFDQQLSETRRLARALDPDAP